MEMKYENDCRKKFYELLEVTPRRDKYSTSQMISVMVVMNCDADEACRLLDKLDEYIYLDWSEASWWEMRFAFVSLKNYLSEVAETQEV